MHVSLDDNNNSVIYESAYDSKIPSIERANPIFKIASDLINAGWDGKDQTEFKPILTDCINPALAGYNVVFLFKDFPEIQKIVQDKLMKQTTDSSQPLSKPLQSQMVEETSSVEPPCAPIEEHSYENALELLRIHLYNLTNPFLVKDICKELENFLNEPIDLAEENKMISRFENSSFPYETKGLFKKLILAFISNASRDLSSLDQIVETIKNKLKEFISKLRESNENLLKKFKNWVDLERLFTIPAVMALKESEVKNIMELIDLESPEKLQKCFDVLIRTKVLDGEQVLGHLKKIDYKYSLNILLGQIINKKLKQKNQIINEKPKQKEGIIACWKQPEEYFVNKTLDLHSDSKGVYHFGTIVKAKKKNGILKLYLNDRSEVNISSKKEVSFSNFERSHFVIKKEIKSLTWINGTNADEFVLIKPEHEDKLRLMQLEQVTKILNAIQTEFLREENQNLLERLLDNLSGNQLKQVNFNLVRTANLDIANRIEELSQKYFDDLRIERFEEDILKQIVLEANYITFVDKKDNVVIARTMELIKNAFEYIKNIEGRDLIFVMGNTGSGKSTTTSFLMGAALEEFSNKVGEKVVRVAEGQKTFPKIGQSIGTSETIYTQGFEIPNAKYLLGDCPGFNDTRGGDYELCINMSIDQAIKKVKGIRAIVIVVPVNAALVDRGNIIMNLIHVVKQMFPNTFEVEKPENNKNIFLLFTEQNQTQSEVLKRLKDGTHFSELAKKAQRQINELINRGGCQLDDFAIQSINKRRSIWKTLEQMSFNDQIHFIDTKDDLQREELLERYVKNNSYLDEEQYVSVMSGQYMEGKFGNTIQMSAHTWIHHIFKAYVEILPAEILSLEKEIRRKNYRLCELNKEKTQRLTRVGVLVNKIAELENFIKKFENETDIQGAILCNELLIRAAEQTNNKLINEEKEALESVKNKMKSKEEELQELEAEIKNFNQDIEQNKTLINKLKEEIAPLKLGDNVTQLHCFKKSSDDKLRLVYWKLNQARVEAAKRMEIESGDLGAVAYEGKAKDYKGKTAEVAIIERGYQLVPSDPTQRQAFINSGQGGGYIAKVDGLRYHIDLMCTAMPDGKKVSYGYELEWLGEEPLPYIQISHTIPNYQYNYATIIDKESEIALLEKKLISLNKELNGGELIMGAEKRRQNIKTEIAVLEQEKKNHCEKIKELEKEYANEQIKNLLIQTKKFLAETKTEKAKLEKTKEIDDEIAEKTLNILNDQKGINEIKKKIKYLAIVIYTQWESAKLLRQFADLMIEENKAMTQTRKTCEEFMKVYDKNKDTLLPQIKNEYAF